jgi:protein-S-isoprenylcysteine O-methyltransferase Ste14
MDTGQNILALCWTVQGLYWIIGAANIRAEHKEIGQLTDLWHYLLLLLALILLNLSLYTDLLPLTQKRLYLSGLFTPVAVLLAVVGLVISVWARQILASNWTASVVFFKPNQLIRKGLYRYIRHPIYAGFLMMVLGTALFAGTVSALIGFLIVLLTLFLMIVQEEKYLIKQFPKEYLNYKKQVKALVPFIL